MLGIFTPSGQSQVAHFILGHLDFNVAYFPFPLLLTLNSSQQLFSFLLPVLSLVAKFIELRSWKVLWKHCHGGTAEIIHR